MIMKEKLNAVYCFVYSVHLSQHWGFFLVQKFAPMPDFTDPPQGIFQLLVLSWLIHFILTNTSYNLV